MSHSSSDVRQLDSSGYLSVPPGSGANEVSDSNSPESNTQSFLSYLQDHAASTGGNGKTFTTFRLLAMQLEIVFHQFAFYF